MRTLAHVSAAAICAAGLVTTAQAAPIDSPYNTLTGEAPIVIGHRGAPAYLPENTIGGNELAAKMGSDYIETDVMMTSDGVIVTMHDTSLERTTNVEEIYGPRNGGYAVSEFTYDEIRALTVEPTRTASETYPGFTPTDTDPYRVPTFADMLDALTAYNQANGTSIGMLTELKYSHDADTNRVVMETLLAKGYDTPEESAVQSFDFENVREFASLLAEAGVEMNVAQLGRGDLLDDVWTVSGQASFDDLAEYSDWLVLNARSITEDLITSAHGSGLSVYAWTFRPTSLEEAFAQSSPFLDWGLDGFATDNPDYFRAAVDAYGVAAIPAPAALPLLSVGLVGLAGLGRLRRRRN